MLFNLHNFLALAITAMAILFLHPIAAHIGLVDVPGGRKKHQNATPVIGGIAMFCGFCFGILSLNISLQDYRAYLAGCLLLVGTGILDDFHELKANQKLFAQIIVAIMITLWGKTLILNIGALFSSHAIHLHFFSMILTMVAIIGVINAINLIDGLDGLAGGLATIQLACLSWLALRAQDYNDAKILLLLICICLSFLFFNFPLSNFQRKYKIFMGDAGSMFLGLSLAWFTIKLSQAPQPAAHPITMLWILAVPILDTFAAIIRRLTQGQSPFRPDRYHFHHILLMFNIKPSHALLMICMLSAILASVGIIGEIYHIPEKFMFIGFIFTFILYLYIIYRGWKAAQLLNNTTKNP